MISVHTNRCGVTVSFPATRNTEAFQLLLNFWQWGAGMKGPVIGMLYPRSFECVSLAGYMAVTY